MNYTLATHPGLEVARHVDRELAAICDTYDVLLSVTPVNDDEAYRLFRDEGCEVEPRFEYRPIDIDPAKLKRRLYNVPLEDVDEETLQFLLREKRREIEGELTLIEDRLTPQFKFVSMQLFGAADDELCHLAEGILGGLAGKFEDGEEEDDEVNLGPEDFCKLAEAEIDGYRRSYPKFKARCEVRDDVVGLVVSKNKLLIGDEVTVAESRVAAALHHEIGTHILTYYNGKAQPLRLLCTGLPGYDELQEGLAVLAEYLTGGLTRSRLRLLAGRVVTVRVMAEGSDFVDSFRILTKEHGFSKKLAYNICMRVYRGGGFTKDAVYLRGLKNVLDYLATGEDYEELFIGKFSLGHMPQVRALRQQGLLKAPPLQPRYLEHTSTRNRLQRLKEGLSVLDLIEKRPA